MTVISDQTGSRPSQIVNEQRGMCLRVGSRSFELQTVVLTSIGVFQGGTEFMIQNPTLKIQIQKFSLGRNLGIW